MRRSYEPNWQVNAARRNGGENWAQFELGDPEIEAAKLAQLEVSLHLKRGWNAEGAANVYMRSKGALWAVGQDVAGCHRFRHRRWASEHCGKICLAHDLYAYCLLCLPTDLHPRVMPISAILGRLIAQALRFDFAASPSFHREVTRDLRRLHSVLNQPLAERSQADKALLLRYAGTAGVVRANRTTGGAELYHRTN